MQLTEVSYRHDLPQETKETFEMYVGLVQQQQQPLKLTCNNPHVLLQNIYGRNTIKILPEKTNLPAPFWTCPTFTSPWTL